VAAIHVFSAIAARGSPDDQQLPAEVVPGEEDKDVKEDAYNAVIS
jgi:hypothetical protein